MKSTALFAIILIFVICTGCGSVSFVSNDGYNGPRASVKYTDVKVLTSPPSCAYSDLGLATAETDATFGSMDKTIKDLKKIAAKQGGNAIIVLDSKGKSYSHNFWTGYSGSGATARATIIYIP